jgi:hypothetical protein
LNWQRTFFSPDFEVVFSSVVATFLARSTPQVKPEMGMPAMRRKQGTSDRRGRRAFAAQHI